MQRLYSMFPQGGPGVGLLLLRLATAAMFAMNLTHRFDFSSFHWAIVSFIVLVSISICVGFLTPVLAVLACAAAVANLFFAEQSLNMVYVLRTLTSAALFFLGPGAYSIDAKLFGLRVTVVPPRKDKESTTTVN